MNAPLPTSFTRHSRKSCLVALLLMAGLLLSPQVTGATATSPLDGFAVSPATSTFVVAGPGFDGITLDPALATDGGSLLIARQIYDTLLFYQEGGSKPVPGLAHSWNVSADGLAWTFHLRSGVRFHDGTALDASAIVANINRWWDPGNPFHSDDFIYFQALFGGFKGDPDCLLKSVSASGDDVLMTLARPFSPLPSILAFQAFGIASPAAFAGGALATAPVGSGAFRFVERIEGDHVTLAANTGYWGGAPASDTLIFRAMNDYEERLEALRAGEVHVAEYVSAPNDELTRTLGRGATTVGYLGINRARTPLANSLVRQAIAHLVNKPAITAFGPGQIATQFLPTGIWGRDPSIAGYAFDPAKARALLAQAGFPAGFSTTLSYRNVARGYMYDPRPVAETLRSDFAQAGIKLNLLELESSEFLGRVNNGDVDLFLLGWGADYPHPDNFFRPHFCSGWKAFLPEDAELCDTVTQALHSNSYSEQQGLYERASRRVHDTVPVVPLLNGSAPMATRRNVVGIQPSPINAESYRLASLAVEAATTVTPDQGAAVGYSAGETFTTVQIPAGAVSSPTQVTVSPAAASDIPAGLASGGHAFEVSATAVGRSPQAFPLAQPAIVTVEYSRSDLTKVKEKTLDLYAWDGQAWIPASETCSPPSTAALDLLNRRVIVPACQLGRFALLGEPLKSIYLPVLRR